MTRKGDWVELHSGKRFYPLDPRPEDVVLSDIIHALSNICRFNGHTREFYSVAEHSMLLHNAAALAEHPERVLVWGLLHDAAEAYIGDMVRPLKHNSGAFAKEFRAAEARIILCIGQALGLPADHATGIVGEFDKRLLVTEGEQVFPKPAEWTRAPHWVDVPRLPVRVRFWSPQRARNMFLTALSTYLPADIVRECRDTLLG